MSKDDTPKFTLTLPLQVSPEEHSVLVKSQQASRKIYNAVLGEAHLNALMKCVVINDGSKQVK